MEQAVQGGGEITIYPWKYLNDLEGLFKPKQFYDSTREYENLFKPTKASRNSPFGLCGLWIKSIGEKKKSIAGNE